MCRSLAAAFRQPLKRIRVASHLASCSRYQHTSAERPRILSKEFALDDVWEKRKQQMRHLGFGEPREWMAAVQKKFTGGGNASAADVDIAVSMAYARDQKDDLLDVIYKLRHTDNTADMLPSTEYAVFRYLIKFDESDDTDVFKLINDPINYGVFLNVHTACLLLDHLLGKGNVQGATKVATSIMQQEMFDNVLLNLLSLYSLHKWDQLPAEEKKFSEHIQPALAEEDDHDEEDIKTMKYPYLKNEWSDGHFDLVDEVELVAKSNEWFARELPDGLRSQFVPAVAAQNSAWDWSSEPLLSLRRDNERQIMEQQQGEFAEWDARREQITAAQSEKAKLREALSRIAARRQEITAERDLLFFFENRLQWEDAAKAKDELFEEFDLIKKEATITEGEYAESIFERARSIIESTVTKSK